MSDLDTDNDMEFNLSESETVYTHFRPNNASIQASDVELPSTISDDDIVAKSNIDSSSKAKSCVLKCCEVFVLLMLIVTVWLAMSIPTVFFYVSQGSNSNRSDVDPAHHMTNTTCTAREYTGSVCTKYLKSYQRCLPGANNSATVYIPGAIDQNSMENIVNQIDAAIQVGFASRECAKALLPLACLYYFELCDRRTDTVVSPTYGQCIGLRDEVCRSEWHLATMTGYGHFLPICEQLPMTSSKDAPSSNCSLNASTERTRPPPSCSDGFHPDDGGQCRPTCGKWSPYSEVERHISDVFIIIAAAIAIVSGSAVLILACVRCKKVFSYPSVFIVYQTVPTIILGGLVLVAFVDREGLFCSSMEYLESVKNPTTFCTLTGITLYYIMMQLLLLWFFHVLSMCWGVHWPIKASMLQASPKRIVLHIIAACLALFLPIIPVCIIHFVAPGGFTITRFPPILCAGRSLKFNFYSFMLPISIIIASGLSFLVLIFWKLLKRRILHRIRQTRIDTNWCTHVRLLIVLCYFLVFGIVVLSTFTASMINLNIFFETINKYFQCEATRPILMNTTTTADSCDREALVSLINPVTTTIAFIVLGFYPAANLVFVLHLKELRDNCMCCRTTREVEYTYRENRPYSAYHSSSSSVQGVRLHTHGLY